jgi:transcriptional regulator
MYMHPKQRITDLATLQAVVAAHQLGAWVCQGHDGLVANHVPFHLDRSRGALGTLIGHVARANPVWRTLGGHTSSVVMFRGPQAYITPGWYPGKQAHGQVVPTWNYVVAHAHGIARVVEDPVWMLAMLDRLTAAHEARQPAPWSVDDAPAGFIARLMRTIVGIEIPIDRLEGKLKASQDEDLADRLGTVVGLRRLGCPEADAVARWMLSVVEDDPAGAA